MRNTITRMIIRGIPVSTRHDLISLNVLLSSMQWLKVKIDHIIMTVNKNR